MGRVGVSPTRKKVSEYRPARVTVAVLTYIPDQHGYFKQRFDILKLTLGSIIANTNTEYDLLVFDNGSCAEVVDYLGELRDAQKIDYLLLSPRNLGKIGALKIMFNAAPGELIAYADDDILFYPGWLEAHLNAYDTFSKVGMVSGLPVRNESDRASQSMHAFIAQKPKGLTVRYERVIPQEWEDDWAKSTGRDPKEHATVTADHQDLTLEMNGLKVFGSANHFQYLAPKHALLNAMPDDWSGRLMGQMHELDESIDQQGLIRLSTLMRYTRHIGNIISSELVAEVAEMGLDVNAPHIMRLEGKHWILRIPGMGRVLWKVYDWVFQVLHGVRGEA